MITAKNAIAAARALIGTPYSELDCINLIKKVIRTAPGGVPGYTTAGTNSLWDSYTMTAKYRDLTWRWDSDQSESTIRSEARAGMLAFKRSGNDVHHIGIITDDGTIIHSSSTQGGRGVVEEEFDEARGWKLLAIHRHIEPGIRETEGEDMEAYKARVSLSDPESWLNVRSAPDARADRIGKLTDGAIVTVQAEPGSGWAYVTYGDIGLGYVMKTFIERIEHEPEAPPVRTMTSLIDDEGHVITLMGNWRVAED